MTEEEKSKYALHDVFRSLVESKKLNIGSMDIEKLLKTNTAHPLIGFVERSLLPNKMFGWNGARGGISLDYLGADTGKEKGGPKEGIYISYQGRDILVFYHNGYGRGTVLLEDKKAREALSKAFRPEIFGDHHDRSPHSRHSFNNMRDPLLGQLRIFLENLLE
jgi:hypothetical protein